MIHEHDGMVGVPPSELEYWHQALTLYNQDRRQINLPSLELRVIIPYDESEASEGLLVWPQLICEGGLDPRDEQAAREAIGSLAVLLASRKITS